MAKKKVYTVRVINFLDHRDTLPGLWVEQLRHLGYLKILGENQPGKGVPRQVLEFRPPSAASSQVWADMESARMRSFGLNAVAAPEWEPMNGPINLDV